MFLSSFQKEPENSSLEASLLKSLAYLIFDALDYGNSCQNEPDLKNTLQNLLVKMSGHYREYLTNNKQQQNNNNPSNLISEHDEGYEQDYEYEETGCGGGGAFIKSISLEMALNVCTSNVSEEAAAEYHYKAVCRGLYAQAYELKVFLAKIEHSKVMTEHSKAF